MRPFFCSPYPCTALFSLVQRGAALLHAIQLDAEHGGRQQPGGDEAVLRHGRGGRGQRRRRPPQSQLPPQTLRGWKARPHAQEPLPRCCHCPPHLHHRYEEAVELRSCFLCIFLRDQSRGATVYVVSVAGCKTERGWVLLELHWASRQELWFHVNKVCFLSSEKCSAAGTVSLSVSSLLIKCCYVKEV